MRLKDQVALITGCGRVKGIGRATALALAKAGADLAITDVAPGGTRNVREAGEEEARLGWQGLASLADEIERIGRQVLTLVGDVSVKADAERMVTAAIIATLELGEDRLVRRNRRAAGPALGTHTGHAMFPDTRDDGRNRHKRNSGLRV